MTPCKKCFTEENSKNSYKKHLFSRFVVCNACGYERTYVLSHCLEPVRPVMRIWAQRIKPSKQIHLKDEQN